MATQIIYGPDITTDDMHEVRKYGIYDRNVYGQYANEWFKHYVLIISAPAGWHFTGEPSVHCVKDNDGSFGWNNFARAPDRFFITQRTPTFIECTCWAGSHPIIINLACEASQ